MAEKFRGGNVRFLFLTILVVLGFAIQSFGSQNDYVIDNAGGAIFRADINSALQASQSLNSATTAPTTTYPFQMWMDTSGSAPILKFRNAANSAWTNLGDFSGAISFVNTDYIKIPSGTTAQRPSIPVSGMIRYNSDLGSYEGYHGSSYYSFKKEINPTIQKLTSGSGTYTTPTGVKYLRIRMVGGGGGGQASALSSWGNYGATGGDTAFGSSLLIASGGGGGVITGGIGGAFTVNSPAIDIGSAIGSYGFSGANRISLSIEITSGSGGNSPLFGGGATGLVGATAGGAGRVNTGGGGSGGSSVGNDTSGTVGAGGGSGGVVHAQINNPSATYSYSIGAGGAGGAAGTYPGGAGGSGIIIVEEYY